MTNTILLLGANGQLGTESQITLSTLGEVFAHDYPEIDFGNQEQLRALVREVKPDLIFNAAAYTAVDRAESEPELVHGINAIASQVLAQEAKRQNALLVHFSTDYVFNGKKGSPYLETDATAPLNVYGQTKLDGEKLVEAEGGKFFIFRTSWVFSRRPTSFLGKVLSWSRKHETLKIVDDQIGSPTWARALAEVSTQAIVIALCKGQEWQKQHSGVYHLGGDGAATRKEWAEAILEFDPNKDDQIVKQVLSARSADFPTPAERPLETVLDCSKFRSTFNLSLPNWKDALRFSLSS